MTPVDYVTNMVTGSARKLPVAYLRDHRKARNIRVLDIAARMGIERESVYRLERRAMGLEEHSFLDVGSLVQYAAAIGEKNPLNLFYPPDTPSLDELLRNEPSQVRALAADLVRTLISRR